jgi:hypothetical protein
LIDALPRHVGDTVCVTLPSVDEAIDLLLEEPNLRSLVYRYFEPGSPFAGHSFDTIGSNPPEHFTEGDLLAVTLLDVGCGPPAVRALLTDPDRWTSMLSEVPADLDLWAIDQRVYDRASNLWDAL